MSNAKTSHPCHAHPDRIAAVDCSGTYKCWQCYLGDEAFFKRFGKDFYKENP